MVEKESSYNRKKASSPRMLDSLPDTLTLSGRRYLSGPILYVQSSILKQEEPLVVDLGDIPESMMLQHRRRFMKKMVCTWVRHDILIVEFHSPCIATSGASEPGWNRTAHHPSVDR